MYLPKSTFYSKKSFTIGSAHCSCINIVMECVEMVKIKLQKQTNKCFAWQKKEKEIKKERGGTMAESVAAVAAARLCEEGSTANGRDKRQSQSSRRS